MNRGRILTMLLVLAGVAAAATAIWFQSRQMGRIIDALGPRVADTIVRSPRVQLARLEASAGPDNSGAEIKIDGSNYSVRLSREITEARGLIHLRAALVHDSSYIWGTKAEPQTSGWEYLMTFSGGLGDMSAVRLAFDLKGERMMLVGDGPTLSIAPLTVGLSEFFREQIPAGEMIERR